MYVSKWAKEMKINTLNLAQTCICKLLYLCFSSLFFHACFRSSPIRSRYLNFIRIENSTFFLQSVFLIKCFPNKLKNLDTKLSYTFKVHLVRFYFKWIDENEYKPLPPLVVCNAISLNVFDLIDFTSQSDCHRLNEEVSMSCFESVSLPLWVWVCVCCVLCVHVFLFLWLSVKNKWAFVVCQATKFVCNTIVDQREKKEQRLRLIKIKFCSLFS